MVNILYSFDTKFWMLAMASIYSALRSKNPDTVYTFYCMVAPGTGGRKKINKLVRRFGCKLVWRVVRSHENPYRGMNYSRWSPVIFYRLFAHKIFPDVQRMIYLDSDTIVLKDLTALFETDLGNNILAGVEDFGSLLGTDEHVMGIIKNYKNDDLYINSGVLLINLSAMPEWLAADCELVYPDQDLINVALDGKIKKLHMRYNYIPGRKTDESFPKLAQDDAVIYHYYSTKPFYETESQSYLLFENLAEELGYMPAEFAKHDEKFTQTKTNIPFVRIHKNKIKLFGITMMRF